MVTDCEGVRAEETGEDKLSAWLSGCWPEGLVVEEGKGVCGNSLEEEGGEGCSVGAGVEEEGEEGEEGEEEDEEEDEEKEEKKPLQEQSTVGHRISAGVE